MRSPQLVTISVLAALAVVGCKRRSTPTATPPVVRDGGSSDGGTAVIDGDDGELVVDEAILRAGKPTGLAGADDRPGVATEEFIALLLSGDAAWARVIEPDLGVVELRTLDDDGHSLDATMGRRCRQEIPAALARLAKLSGAALAEPALGYQWSCDNSGLTDPIAPTAVCSLDSNSDVAIGLDLVFVPDRARGLRLIGITALDASPPSTAIQDAFDVELGKSGTLCR
jgi:hypothetical protein